MMAVALVPLSDLAVETGLALPVGATRIAPGIWMLIILCHALLSVLFALALRRTLPARFQQPRRAMTGFLFAMFLALPGVGPLILLLSGFYLRTRPARFERERDLAQIDLPLFDSNLRKSGGQRVVGMAARALRTPMPTEKKLQALMSLQEQPSAASTRLLREALTDGEDEIRLLAYTIVDRQEKRLMNQIIRLQARLEEALKTAPTGIMAMRLLHQLSELHWEMIHRHLAQGELSRFLLKRGLQHADHALALDPEAIPLRLLRARLRLRLGDRAAAREDIQTAHALGAAPSQTLPWLAELAFREGDFRQLRAWLAQLGDDALSPRLRRLRRMWVRGHE